MKRLILFCFGEKNKMKRTLMLTSYSIDTTKWSIASMCGGNHDTWDQYNW